MNRTFIWYLNKKSGEAQIFGSRTAAANHTGVRVEKLYYHLNANRGKKIKFETGDHVFVLVKVITSKRKDL